MSMRRILLAAGLSVVLVGGIGVADEALKSGPQVGQEVPGPFHPLNCTGAAAGQKHCLYCENGVSPVAMIFAREVTPELTRLIKQIDDQTAKNQRARMGSFVVFLSDKEGLAGQLKGLAQNEALKHIVLSIDNPAGPEKYSVARDAQVTVVLYSDHIVRNNYAFRTGQLNDQAINQIVAAIPKVVAVQKQPHVKRSSPAPPGCRPGRRFFAFRAGSIVF
jgi:hypothetical protein